MHPTNSDAIRCRTNIAFRTHVEALKWVDQEGSQEARRGGGGK